MSWEQPPLFVLGLFAVCAVGALLPIRVERREDHIVVTIAASVAAGILGPPSLLLVWGAVLLAAPLHLGWALLPRNSSRLGWAGGARAVGWTCVTGLALTTGFIASNLVYAGVLGHTYPIQLATTAQTAVAGLVITVGWAATMSVRIVTVRLVTGSLMPHGLDPFDSVLIPYLLPLIGGFPLVTAAVALYGPADPWPCLIILWWCFPLYLATAYDLRRRRMAQELRRDALAKQRLAAIGEVSARIVHQSRHQVGLMGWSIHRLRAQVGLSTPEAIAAVEQELDALAEAKDRLSQMLASELLHERSAAAAGTTAGRPEPTSGVGALDGHGDRGTSGNGSTTGTATATGAPDGNADGGASGGGAGASAASGASLAGVVGEVVEQLRREAEREGVRLRCEVGAGSGTGAAAPQLRDVVFNLVDNAIDAATSEVVVQLDEQAGATRIEVRDDGAGAAGEDPARLFEPFFTTKGDGTGMGLAIADALVGDLGGEVRYEREDGWTQFVVTLPPVAEPARR